MAENEEQMKTRSIYKSEIDPWTEAMKAIPATGAVLENPSEVRTSLLREIGRQMGVAADLSQLVEQIVRMTQLSLNSSASSVLLLDKATDELVFEIAQGDACHALKQVRLSINNGIAGWVVRHRRPLIINDVNSDERFYKKVDVSTGFITRSIMCAPLIVHNDLIGVIEVLNKKNLSDFDHDDLETLESVAATAAIALENTRLQQSLEDGYKATIRALAAAIDAKDPYTCGHSQRVTDSALMAGAALKLPRKDLQTMEYAGILHDIGKIGIPDALLLKPASLTDEERMVIRRHPIIGADIINGVPFLAESRKLVLYHHERYDGKGYPHGLKAEEIPPGARILSIADSFDSMTTDRAYRRALTVDYALNELVKCAGTQFCPVAVNAFVTEVQCRSKLFNSRK